ncbi:thiol-disulfide isomerase/thioredoxin [Pedobacter sp. UYP24]
MEWLKYILKVSTYTLLFLAVAHSSKAQIKVGEIAPELSIKDWIKNVPDSKDLKGKFIVIDFWATWCAPCLETLPHMNTLVEQNKSRKDLVFLALTDEKKDKVNSLLKRVSFSAAVVTDPTRKIFDEYKIDQIPTCVIIDDKSKIKWVGHPSKLNNQIIQNILNGQSPESLPIDENPSPQRMSKVADSLSKRYGTYFMDDEIKEYFNLGPLSAEKAIMKMWGGRKIIVVGYSLKDEFANFLHVASNQVVLPEKIAKSRLSYLYKTKEIRKDSVLFNLILDRLNLKYKIKDTLVEVMQFEVVDKGLLKKVEADPLSKSSRASSSESYIGVVNSSFSSFKSEIEDAFNTIVVLKEEKNFEKKVSLTLKKDNLESLKTALKSYGIEVSFLKKIMPAYIF